MTVQYDRAVIYKHAEALYAEANAILALYAMVGALPGIVVYVLSMFSRMPGAEVVAFALGVCGVLIGLLAGRSRAFALKLQAQLALCQVRIEENTSAMLGAATGAGQSHQVQVYGAYPAQAPQGFSGQVPQGYAPGGYGGPAQR